MRFCNKSQVFAPKWVGNELRTCIVISMTTPRTHTVTCEHCDEKFTARSQITAYDKRDAHVRDTHDSNTRCYVI